MRDEPLLKSYVWHYDTDQWFFVSTIERDSSACVTPAPRFMETLAWEWDWETQRGKQVAETGNGHAPTQHFEVCGQLYEHGKYTEVEA